MRRCTVSSHGPEGHTAWKVGRDQFNEWWLGCECGLNIPIDHLVAIHWLNVDLGQDDYATDYPEHAPTHVEKLGEQTVKRALDGLDQ